ncbi:MAG: adenylate/guanylate cyclase domain-containing protein, partial [Acidobacteriota bacterium]|nr:adenylate/guanylate cyclase domain-containing protein [Acidobacteriota bacterium]
MTLRRRWTISILAILGLFGLNLFVYVWGNALRSDIILALKVALERKDLTVEVRNSIEDRHRDAEVMEPLIASGAVRLSEAEVSEIRARTETIGRRIERLQALSGTGETKRLGEIFSLLQTAWLDLYSWEVRAESEVGKAKGAEEIDEGEIEAEIDGEEALGENLPRLESSDGPPTTHYALHREIAELLADLLAQTAEHAEMAEEEFGAVARLTDRITLAIFALSSMLAVAIAVWFSRFLRGTFARYVPAEVVANVLETPQGLRLGGEKRRITLLMADLRGFSALSERLAPEKVVAVINNFLGTMTGIILEAGGTIDEFIGDAILVFFGAPTARNDHAEAAVTCAIRMQLAMAVVNEKNRQQDLPAVEMGIGIHTGEVVVGNIGSEKRTKYGAVGTNVNLVGRIEANTVGGQILVSEATRSAVESDLRMDGRVEIRPKGFDGEVVLFEVGGIGESGELELPEVEESLAPLKRPIAVSISVLEDKTSEREAFSAELVSVSQRSARIRSATPLELLTDLKLEIPDG